MANQRQFRVVVGVSSTQQYHGREGHQKGEATVEQPGDDGVAQRGRVPRAQRQLFGSPISALHWQAGGTQRGQSHGALPGLSGVPITNEGTGMGGPSSPLPQAQTPQPRTGRPASPSS